jgi:hypothetical protein
MAADQLVENASTMEEVGEKSMPWLSGLRRSLFI